MNLKRTLAGTAMGAVMLAPMLTAGYDTYVSLHRALNPNSKPLRPAHCIVYFRTEGECARPAPTPTQYR
ncbi:MAG: hypothetical protein WAZ18_00730 [Alphaproteobacteria bacterium]